MIPLTRLKKDVLFNTELTKVVDVLKGVAAARFHILERQMAFFEPYFQIIQGFFDAVDLTRVPHPFAQGGKGRTAAVLVTSDAGFLGGLNTQVVNTALEAAGGAQGVYTVIGERGASALRGSRLQMTAFPGIHDDQRLSLALSVRDHLVRQMLDGTCSRLVIVYPKPISFSAQQVTAETLLPCSAWAAPRPAESTSRGGPRPLASSGAHDASLLWESTPSDVTEYVVVQWLGCRLDQIMAWSRLAELSARTVHLEGSYQELLRQGKALKLQYHRSRHEVIDRSIREIFAGQLLNSRTKAAAALKAREEPPEPLA